MHLFAATPHDRVFFVYSFQRSRCGKIYVARGGRHDVGAVQ